MLVFFADFGETIGEIANHKKLGVVSMVVEQCTSGGSIANDVLSPN